jgi:hypothetical protein
MPRRFLVRSKSEPALPYVVTYDEATHEGVCQCREYRYKPNWCHHLTAVVDHLGGAVQLGPDLEPVVVEVR